MSAELLRRRGHRGRDRDHARRSDPDPVRATRDGCRVPVRRPDRRADQDDDGVRVTLRQRRGAHVRPRGRRGRRALRRTAARLRPRDGVRPPAGRVHGVLHRAAIRATWTSWFLMYNAPGGLVAGIRPERGGTAKAMLSFTSAPLDYDRRDVRAAAGDPRARRSPEWAGGCRPARRDVGRAGLLLRHHLPGARGEAGPGAGSCCSATPATARSPLAGLGTSLALVGAYVLAGELAAARGDHSVAFARYQEVMRDYVKQCQTLPPGGVNELRAAEPADDLDAEPVDEDDDALADARHPGQAVPEGRRHHAAGVRRGPEGTG